ncbi:DNA polymerase IV [Kordiimonas pumila]|uniref:DNA polymerase IV n=1 Tax=Kordiimonas pumila TaxID=2161677 RepID=A0ABV7D0P2_9PROT|nr:DNA polymerase IV [Kordiimonas pumila]
MEKESAESPDPETTSLCRSCFHIFYNQPHCPQCGKNRIVTHPELLTLTIAHMDCDAFYAAVEKRDNPELASKPVIIGGETRGVVSTACYIARMYGVKSAMPMYKAKKLCPDAVIIRPDMKRYREAGLAVRAKMLALTPQIEPISIDEAFLDLSGTEKLHKAVPAAMLAKLAHEIEKEIGITISVGLAANKFLAKLASDMNKPRGFTVIGNFDAVSLLATLPVTAIYGIGQKTAKTLARDGLSRISQLQEIDEATLIRRYGETGQRLYKLSRGIDTRKVTAERDTKSISSERTLEKDLASYDELEMKLWRCCEQVAADLKHKNLAGITIHLKLKTSMHRVISRSRTLQEPTQLTMTLFETGKSLLVPLVDGTPYRLIGIGVSQFRDLWLADQPDLLETGRTKKANAERTIDTLKAKFGVTAITTGRSFSPEKSASKQTPKKK